METALIERVEKPVNDTVAKANAIVVKDTPSRLAAAEYLKVIKGIQKEVSDTFDPIVAKAKATHTEACAQRSKYLDPLILAEKNLKNKNIAYDDELARKEREAQAELDRKAKAEEDRKRRELEERARKAEEAARFEREAKERAEAEARAAQEAQRKAEEAAKNAKNAKERAVAAKAEAEARERAEKARREAAEAETRAAKQDAKNEVLTQKAAEVHVEAPVVQSEAVKVAGQKVSVLHDAQITDKMALIKYIATNPNFASLLIGDSKALKQLATATKGSMTIPGIKFFTTKTMSSRAA